MWYIYSSKYLPSHINKGDKIILVIESAEEAEKFKNNKEYYKLNVYDKRQFELASYIIQSIFAYDCMEIARVQITPDVHLLCSFLAALNYVQKMEDSRKEDKFNFHVHEFFFGEEYFTPYWSQLRYCDLDPMGDIIAGGENDDCKK